MVKESAPENQPGQTLAKGLTILGAFSPQQLTWGIRELARELDMNPATVMRLVTTLESAGYLTQDAETQRYVYGGKTPSDTDYGSTRREDRAMLLSCCSISET